MAAAEEGETSTNTAQNKTAGSASNPAIFPCQILAAYPHDSAAFTQGLLFHGGFLYESLGLYGESAVRRVDIPTGRVLQEHAMPETVFGEGLALVGERLLQLTWKARRGFSYRLETLEPLGEFAYEGEGWGLTTGPDALYMTQGGAVVLVRDPETFAIIRRMPVQFRGKPVPLLNELEWVAGRLWANIWQTAYIAIIHPETGDVERFVDLSPCLEAMPPPEPGEKRDVANGIAYDAAGKRLFVTGKRWPRLFHIAVPE